MDIKFARACEGKAPSQGGMLLSEFKSELIKRYPEYVDEIRSMNRKELTNFCDDNSNIKKDVKDAKSAYFKSKTPLTEEQKSYCRCIAHVSAKDSAYNPYAVCTKSVGRAGSFKCTPYYNYDEIPQEEVEGLARLKGKSTSQLRNSSK